MEGCIKNVCIATPAHMYIQYPEKSSNTYDTLALHGNSIYICTCACGTIDMSMHYSLDFKYFFQDNPLGSEGQMAISFGTLMKLMWNGYHSAVSPSNLKVVMHIILYYIWAQFL